MNKKLWLKSYPKLVPKTIKKSSKTLLDFFDETFEKYKGLTMLENMGVKMSYDKVKKLSDKFAAYIQNFTNLKPGDRVAIQMPNLLQYPVAAIGCIKAGMVIVNINPLYTKHEMEKQLADSKAKAIIILENFVDKLESILPNLNIENVIVTKVGDMLGTIKGSFINFLLKYIKNLTPKHSLKNIISFKKTLSAKNITYQKPKISPKDTFCIQYTGGTTGVIKGAILSHKNIIANIEQMCQWIGYKVQEGKEVIVTALPLYHIFSFSLNLLSAMKIGAKSILITNPKKTKSFIKYIKNKKISIMTGVCTLLDAMMKEKNFRKINFSNLKITISGGMNLSDRVAENWEKITGCSVLETYGLTEASPAVIGSPFDGTHKRGSVGLPIPGTDIKILNDENKRVDINEPGRLFVRGPQIMDGYWDNNQETEKVFVDGWLDTGDVAVMDSDGFIKIVDRKKEVINVSGFNVFPSEIETIIAMKEEVLEVAVAGFPCNEFRDSIVAFIVKQKDNFIEEDILKHCRKYLASYKIPHKVVFVAELPKSQVGKVLKRLLTCNDV